MKDHYFIAVDGEGKGNRYTLLAANDASNNVQTYIENDDGLGTADCMRFLWSLQESYPHARYVGFSFNYDVNMMLHPLLKLRKPMVQRLNDKKFLTVRLDNDTTLEIRFYPSKFVIFTDRANGRSIRIEDTFGFYQQSFVKALMKWEMPDTVALQRIEEGKSHRGDAFAKLEPSKVREYCLTECQQLAELTGKLRNAIHSTGIELKKYIGAGAIAQSFMEKYRVDHHVRHDNVFGKEIQDAIMYAYYGGRSEIFKQGYFASETYVYDINSAYPTQTLTLPSLRHGIWRIYRGKNDTLQDAVDAIPYGLCYLSWDMRTPMPKLVPFPRRMPNGNIRYRGKGTGWYWTSEVQTALRHFSDFITIHKIYSFEPNSVAQPFDFVERLAALRLQAKANNLASHQIYKLGLNSLYGKTAQAKRGNRYPAHQSYVWAGMITAGTRAKLLDVIAPNADNVIACATDGVIFASDPKIETGSGLGEWERSTYDELLYIQAGVYFCNGKGINKTRGHILADLHYDDILNGWIEYGPNFEYPYTSRRFVGMGLANHLNDWSKWCEWIDFPRTLRCRPPGKVPETDFKFMSDDGFTIEHTKQIYDMRCLPTLRNEDEHSCMFSKFEIKDVITRTIDEFISKEQPSIPTLF